MSRPYDPTLRRDTPLARKLIARIRRDGPIDTRAYVDACLNDPEHGYYRTKTAIGRAGDFVTAPEISQVFGEIIGLWSAVVWQQMGAPTRVHLIELGAGRGTLLVDALRAAKIMPAYSTALSVHVVRGPPRHRSRRAPRPAAPRLPFPRSPSRPPSRRGAREVLHMKPPLL